MSALGTVVGHRQTSGEGGQTTLLIIRFEADDGRTIDFTGSLGPWSYEIVEGTIVGVEYPAGFPQKARLLGSRPSFLDYGLCLVVLAVLIAFIVNPKWTALI
jgi:hypothetical protein